jgi:hypothetical protein
MSNCILAFPNYIDSTYVGNGYDGVVFSGGSWETAQPLSNLMEPYLVDFAQTTDATLTSTQGDIDLGCLREVDCFILYDNSISRVGKARFRLSDTAKWVGVTLNGAASAGASSISVMASSSGATITSGDYFTITGDDTVYKFTGSSTIAASGTASVNITPNLTANALSTTPLVCRTGDFTSPVLDSTSVDVWPEAYRFGQVNYGHPSFYDGKVSAEDAVGQTYPFIYIPDVAKIGRYIRFEIDDTANVDGCIKIGRSFVAPGWQMTINPIYGLSVGWKSNTITDRTLGQADIFDKKRAEREITFEIDSLPEDEAYSFPYEMQRLLDIDGQFVFIYDPEDTIHLHRRTILARMKNNQALRHSEFMRVGVAFDIKEVIA